MDYFEKLFSINNIIIVFMFLVIFSILPFLAYKTKHKVIMLVSGCVTLLGFIASLFDPQGQSFDGLGFAFFALFFILPVHIICLISWIILIIKNKKTQS